MTSNLVSILRFFWHEHQLNSLY
ncbi:hypothetical protein COMA2_150084 [Candidatus Nitrospira nitrificans]|uniref:Uncharacterized protein n=1 Tax=Candidatus Nitrospira nitrificans TaxID=1742973 RepID=A0A0S4LDV1_9BACT|nr:hypothetical protein COMA2_150084 [Candidatus Nitrospira nitrificans]